MESPRVSTRDFETSRFSRDRRGFLRCAAGLTLGAVVGAPAALAIEPISGRDSAKFKFSLAAYGYRDLLTGDSPKLKLEDFVVDCSKMGLEGTELTSYYFPAEPTNEYLRNLKRLCFELGLDISGTAVANDFCHPPGDKRTHDIEHVKRWIDRAEILGAPVIRIFSGDAKGNAAEAHRLVVEGIEECCHYAGEHGVTLALENHGGLTATAEGLLALVKDVKSPWFGVNLDTGNFTSADIYGDLAKVAPYAVNVQVKVMIRPNNGAKTLSDFGRLASILQESRYRGYIVLEYEEGDDPRTACPRHVDELRKAFKA